MVELSRQDLLWPIPDLYGSYIGRIAAPPVSLL